MNKYLPFVFPAIALAIIGFLTFRWYTMNTPQQPGQVSEFAEGVEIENLTQDKELDMLRGVGDVKKVTMSGEGENAGEIRYELKDGKVNFSVAAGLPELKAGQYQVWLKSTTTDSLRKAFVLEMSKGGFLGSASLPDSLLPFEVVVSQEQNADNSLETVLLKGILAK